MQHLLISRLNRRKFVTPASFLFLLTLPILSHCFNAPVYVTRTAKAAIVITTTTSFTATTTTATATATDTAADIALTGSAIPTAEGAALPESPSDFSKHFVAALAAGIVIVIVVVTLLCIAAQCWRPLMDRYRRRRGSATSPQKQSSDPGEEWIGGTGRGLPLPQTESTELGAAAATAEPGLDPEMVENSMMTIPRKPVGTASEQRTERSRPWDEYGEGTERKRSKRGGYRSLG
ncbi:hypothetical protein GGR57DRAFT_80220 [Xylariaceae sp. FL1272]|nr:hypothetical protein GGR57DRAFT_80220 [Xylariaceae sp. FL1272]